MNIQEQRAALMDTLADMLDGLVSSISLDAQLVRPRRRQGGRVHRTSDRGMAVMGPSGTGLDVGRHRRHAGHAAIRSR